MSDNESPDTIDWGDQEPDFFDSESDNSQRRGTIATVVTGIVVVLLLGGGLITYWSIGQRNIQLTAIIITTLVGLCGFIFWRGLMSARKRSVGLRSENEILAEQLEAQREAVRSVPTHTPTRPTATSAFAHQESWQPVAGGKPINQIPFIGGAHIAPQAAGPWFGNEQSGSQYIDKEAIPPTELDTNLAIVEYMHPMYLASSILLVAGTLYGVWFITVSSTLGDGWNWAIAIGTLVAFALIVGVRYYEALTTPLYRLFHLSRRRRGVITATTMGVLILTGLLYAYLNKEYGFNLNFMIWVFQWMYDVVVWVAQHAFSTPLTIMFLLVAMALGRLAMRIYLWRTNPIVDSPHVVRKITGVNQEEADMMVSSITTLTPRYFFNFPWFGRRLRSPWLRRALFDTNAQIDPFTEVDYMRTRQYDRIEAYRIRNESMR